MTIPTYKHHVTPTCHVVMTSLSRAMTSLTHVIPLGQELTARTHHVGETRKRVVPVRLSKQIDQSHEFPVKLQLGLRYFIDKNVKY